YFVDREQIESLLQHIERCMMTFESKTTWQDIVDQFAVERLGQVLIESVLDVGNLMIDGFIMRDPGGYSDIIDILYDEAVIDPEHADLLKQLILERKRLVRDYMNINH